MQIYIFSPRDEHGTATHRRFNGETCATGYRIPVDADESLLTPAALLLIQTLDGDLSGMFCGDDLMPRVEIWEQHVSIEDAAAILGIPAERATPWRRGYGSYCDAKIERRKTQIYGLHRASSPAELAQFINANAEIPGLHVRTAFRGDAVQISSQALHIDNARAAAAWRHVLRTRL